MILTIIGCQTATPVLPDPIEVPTLATQQPERPTLERLPDNTSEALKTQTLNVSRLVRYASDWEKFYDLAENYYLTVIQFIQGIPLDSGQ
ncbi:MAG: hypothetical protein ACPKOP_04120 [Sphaerochaetaceae bacterium]